MVVRDRHLEHWLYGKKSEKHTEGIHRGELKIHYSVELTRRPDRSGISLKVVTCSQVRIRNSIHTAVERTWPR